MIFKIGNKWLQLFQFGANFSHLVKVIVQEKKQPEGTLSDPKEIILTIFIKSHQMMLHANMNALALIVCHKKILKDFFLKFYVK